MLLMAPQRRSETKVISLIVSERLRLCLATTLSFERVGCSFRAFDSRLTDCIVVRSEGNVMRRLISSNSSFECDIGYSRAVVDGEWAFVSGTTGFDYSTMAISDDVATQAVQCLTNIECALREAGPSFADVVRVRYILPSAEDFPACWPALQHAFGKVRPAATMIEAGFWADRRIKIEIEVTARCQS